ncbi:MAG: hypothetical protein K6A43_10000 [Treponema sp.]|nr:hypothetical protein [Treponema sp.]
MKKLSKLFALLLTVSALVFGLDSCANGSSDDDDNGPSLATFAYDYASPELTITEEDVAEGAPASLLGKKYQAVITYKLYFYESNFIVFADSKAMADGKVLEQKKSTEAKGTYKLIDGDFSNGKVEYQLTHANKNDKLIELSVEEKTLYSGNCVITDGNFDFSIGYRSLEFTKQ